MVGQVPAALSEIIEKMTKTRLLVIGDIMLDRFIYGRVERISPESPVPVLTIEREETMLGGSGNVLSNLAGLKTQAHILSVIGQDDTGQEVLNCLEKQGFDSTNLLRSPDRPTIVKTRYLAGHQQLLRTDSEKKTPLSDTLATALLDKARALMPTVNAIILSDYGKGVLSAKLIAKIIKAAHTHKIPVLVDPKGANFTIYKGADVITPNKKELSEATGGAPVSTDENIVSAAQTLIKNCHIGTVLATRSGDGMSVIRKNSPPLHLRSTDLEVFDVSGAGDTVIATAAAAIAAGASLENAARLANLAGGLVVAKVGTAPIRAQELLEALHSDEGERLTRTGQAPLKIDRARRADICGWDEAAEQIRRWKARGLKTGFTNGCFDILHYGHVEYLNAARDRCDRLILGLNTDASIRLLKGPDRPVHDENARAHLMSALGCVDMVVLFGAEKTGDDNTACALLDILKPDLYFKGGDYTVEQIPEAPTVLKHGGEIEIMPAFEGYSTTTAIEKIRKAQA